MYLKAGGDGGVDYNVVRGGDMSDVITGLRQAIQDLVAPDLKALMVRQDALQRQSEIQYDSVMKTLEAFRAEMRSEFAALASYPREAVSQSVLFLPRFVD
jgi:hypothetical protein